MQDGYFDSNDFKDILQRYEDALEEGEDIILDSEELTSIAEYYQAQGDTAKGLAAAEYALSLYANATAPLLFKARVALLQDNAAEKALDLAGCLLGQVAGGDAGLGPGGQGGLRHGRDEGDQGSLR